MCSVGGRGFYWFGLGVRAAPGVAGAFCVVDGAAVGTILAQMLEPCRGDSARASISSGGAYAGYGVGYAAGVCVDCTGIAGEQLIIPSAGDWGGGLLAGLREFMGSGVAWD
ncbi:hypothetical protein Tco_1228131 [Tanacetum coccineum]